MENNIQTVEELIPVVKAGIIKQLNIDMTPDALDTEMALFGEGLGLDSIDALELIVLLQQHYQVKITDPQQGPEIFKSVRTMAEYITAHQTN